MKKNIITYNHEWKYNWFYFIFFIMCRYVLVLVMLFCCTSMLLQIGCNHRESYCKETLQNGFISNVIVKWTSMFHARVLLAKQAFLQFFTAGPQPDRAQIVIFLFLKQKNNTIKITRRMPQTCAHCELHTNCRNYKTAIHLRINSILSYVASWALRLRYQN